MTVDRKSGSIISHPETEVTDLPGIYSLSPYTEEEIVSRQFILNEKPKGIINIVDATNIERNLYLTMQLMELQIPMVLALNMMDEVRGNGGYIDVNLMADLPGIPVIPILAAKNEGIDELISHAIHVARYQECTARTDFCEEDDAHGGAVHRCLHGIMYLIKDHAERAGIPLRFAATKAVEGDRRIIGTLALEENEKDMLGHIVTQMEQERGADRAAAIADMRFAFIQKVTDACVVKPKVSKERERSEKIDRILTGKYTVIPMFVLIMALVFWLTFSVLGASLQTLLEQLIDSFTVWCEAKLVHANVNPVICSLIIDGVFNGVGTVLGFLPIIIILFFLLSLLEDTGYMARIAFVMDRLLRKIGLSGRSIVPLLIGFGCSVPGVMASRTLPSERDRKMTVMLVPFMSSTAKLPIYAFFAGTFFPGHEGAVMIGLYVLGVVTGLFAALIMRRTLFKGEPVPFVMELPNYRLPGLKNVLLLMWEKAKDFLERAFTVIFMASVVIWFLQNFDLQMNMVSDSSVSILAGVAGVLAPLFAPPGFGDWRMVTALIPGFMAKESVVSTITILFGTTDVLKTVMTSSTAIVFLVFCLLYTPCVAAVSAIRREPGTKWMLAIVAMQCSVAWLAAFVVRLILFVF